MLEMLRRHWPEYLMEAFERALRSAGMLGVSRYMGLAGAAHALLIKDTAPRKDK